MKDKNRNEYWSFSEDDAFIMASIYFGKDPRDMPIISNRNGKAPRYPTGDQNKIVATYSWLEGPPSRLALNQLHQYDDDSIEYTRRGVPPYFSFEDEGNRNTVKEWIADAKSKIANSDIAEDTGYHGLKTSDL